MVILQKHNFRIASVSVLSGTEKGFTEKPLKYGLAIEKQYSGSLSDFYYVIAFIKYNKKEDYSEIESIGTRLLDLEDNEFPIFKDLTNIAINMVNVANKSYDCYEEDKAND